MYNRTVVLLLLAMIRSRAAPTKYKVARPIIVAYIFGIFFISLFVNFEGMQWIKDKINNNGYAEGYPQEKCYSNAGH